MPAYLRHRPRRVPSPAEKAEPGELIQVDVKYVQIAGRWAFQYTALDDCMRFRVLRLYRRLHHGSSLAFLAELRRAFPFPIQLQCDHGQEFSFAFDPRTPPETLRPWQPIGKRATVDRWHILGRQDSKSAVSRRPPLGERFRLMIHHECTNGHAWTAPLVPRLGLPPGLCDCVEECPDPTRTAAPGRSPP